MFLSCVTNRGGVLFGVPNGKYTVDRDNCRRCLCNGGSLSDCRSSQKCETIQPQPASCTYKGDTIPHGEKFNVCNLSLSPLLFLVLLLVCDFNRWTATDVAVIMDKSGALTEGSVLSVITALLVMTSPCLKYVE